MQSEKKRARVERTMFTYKVCSGAQNSSVPQLGGALPYISRIAQSLVSDITDEAAQLDAEVQQLQKCHTELRETTFRACR